MALNLPKYGFRFLNIETCGNCNMNCKFCNWDSRSNKQAILDEITIHRLVDEATARDSGCEAINFSQFNEPLLDKRLFDFISYTKKRGMPVILVSNGLLLGKDKILEGMLSSPPDELTLSVQILNQGEFGRIRGINMDLTYYTAIIYKFLSAIRDTNMQVTIAIACNFLTPKKRFIRHLLGFNMGDPNAPLSLDDVSPNLVRFLDGLQAHDSTFAYDLAAFNNYINSLDSDYRKQGSFDLASNIRVKIKRFMYGQRLMKFEPSESSFACTHPILAVLASGHVVPCCHMSSPFVSMGNVKDRAIEDILGDSAEFIHNIRGKNGKKPDVCKRCFGERTKRALWLIKMKEKFGFDTGFHPLRHS